MDTTIPSSDRPVSIDRPRLPAVTLFDVNETLSDMLPMAARFVDVGAPAHLAVTWFAALLRDGFALAAAGSTAPLAQLGTGVSRAGLDRQPLNRTVDEAIEHIMGGLRRAGRAQRHPRRHTGPRCSDPDPRVGVSDSALPVDLASILLTVSVFRGFGRSVSRMALRVGGFQGPGRVSGWAAESGRVGEFP